MPIKEKALLDRFVDGLTKLADRIELKNRIRYLDDNITAELLVFCMMRIIRAATTPTV